MAGHKLTANEQRRVDQLLEYQKVTGHVKRLTLELESNRAARQVIIDNICAQIARELAQLRQKAMTAPVGTVGDVAGSLGVLAGRPGTGLMVKLRALNDGLNTMNMQIDLALKQALHPEPEKKDKKKEGPPQL
jgi:hypothetical protein